MVRNLPFMVLITTTVPEKPDEADVVLFYSAISQYNNVPQLLDAWIISWTPGEPVVEAGTVNYTLGTGTAGTQYADEERTINEDLKISTHNKGCHFHASDLRIYQSDSKDGWAIITSTKVIAGFSFSSAGKAGTLGVYGSVDGITYTLIQEVSVATSGDYTLTMSADSGYKYLKLDALDAQIRIATMSITLA